MSIVLTVTDSFFHEAKVGHNFKSRAKETRVKNSYFMDGPSGTSSYLADFPNGGVVYLRGNLFQKGPKAENDTAIAYGAEGLKWGANAFELIHNTIVITRSGGAFLSAPSATKSVTLIANLLAGTGRTALVVGGFAESRILQKYNVHASASNLPDASRIESPRFWLNRAGPLSAVPDPTYLRDAQLPLRSRTIDGGQRTAGALQSPP